MNEGENQLIINFSYLGFLMVETGVIQKNTVMCESQSDALPVAKQLGERDPLRDTAERNK